MIQLRSYQTDISIEACELLNKYKVALLFMECRTGKSITALEAARLYGAKNILFITKKKAIKSIESDALHFDLNVTVINYESVLKVKGNYDIAIIDECHSLGAIGKPNKRQKEVKQIVKGLPIIYISATPNPENFNQLYHTLWVSSYSIWSDYSNFFKWARDYVIIKQKMINSKLMNDYSDTIEAKVIRDIEKLKITYTQTEAGFVNQVIEKVLTVDMPIAERYMAELSKNKVIQGNTTAILADTPVKEMQKMAQLAGGTCITEDGNAFILDTSKADFIKDFFKGKKIAILYNFKKELELLKTAFPNHTEISEEFEESAYKVYLGQFVSTREGVKLSTAYALVMYGIAFSATTYFQLRERHVSKDRQEPAYVYYIFCTKGIENQIYKTVQNKKNFTLKHYVRT